MLISKLEKTKSPEEKTKIMKVVKVLVNVSNVDGANFVNLIIFFPHDHLFEMYICFDIVDNWSTVKISRKDQVRIDTPQQAYTPGSSQECHHPRGG